MNVTRVSSASVAPIDGGASWGQITSMPVSQLGLTALSLASGSGSQFLQRLLCLATDHIGADGAVLMAQRDGRCYILCSVGLPLSANLEIDKAQFARFSKSAGKVLENARQREPNARCALIHTAPFWQSMRPLKLDVRVPEVELIAIFGSHSPLAPRSMREPSRAFEKLVEVFKDLFFLITEIADLSNRPVVFGPVANQSSGIEAPPIRPPQINPADQNVVERFLMDTLIQQPRVLSRGNVSYHAIRRWRRTVKAEQIAALRAIKKLPSDHFEITIAEEMASWCRSAFGNTAFANLVAVPCGHSGEDCLSRRTGQKLAKLLGINFVDAFEPLAVTGSSHPRTNTTRPKMKLATVPVGPVLLVDDVATSGSHLEEATMSLRQHNLAVTSIAWIAAS